MSVPNVGGGCASQCLQEQRPAIDQLFKAIKQGSVERVRQIVQEGQVDVNQSDELGFTPLCRAADGGHLDIVKFLVLEAKALVNLPTFQHRATALRFAAWGGHLDVVQFLVLQAGAAVDPEYDVLGYTPLISAVFKCHVNVAMFLVREGRAQINRVDGKSGETPLAVAALCSSNTNTTLIEYLLKAGASAFRAMDTIPIIVKDKAIMLLAASYDPYILANPELREADPDIRELCESNPPPVCDRVIAARALQMRWLSEGLSRSFTGVHAEIHSIFTTAMQRQPQALLGLDPNAVAFTRVFQYLPAEIQFEISRQVTRCAVKAMIEQAEVGGIAAEQDDSQGTWVAAAARGRQVIERLRFFPDGVKAEARRQIAAEPYHIPTLQQLGRYAGKFPLL